MGKALKKLGLGDRVKFKRKGKIVVGIVSTIRFYYWEPEAFAVRYRINGKMFRKYFKREQLRKTL